jgi:hypothetical protein
VRIRRAKVIGFGAVAALAGSFSARAGMPAPWVLTDSAFTRLSTVSFFLAIIFSSAALIRLIWNSLRVSFPRLPHLSYGRALALMCLWGLLFLVVLLMVSAARELMTPGAWERDGAIYKLKQGEGK